MGPTRDVLSITQGPRGCGFYSWRTRRNQTRTEGPEDANYITYCLSTDMQDEQIVFGGEKKLRAAAAEADALFHPKAIAIFSPCPRGLIGAGVHSRARAMKKKLRLNRFAFL